ncbi:hypothetical protein H0H92_007496 [Tricholoma furcatifolium]|nr:hypothetical protein H0H92_007496 [Tricholoma furcatifolium]
MSDNSPFWTAYRTALKNAILPGVPIPGDHQIFALPFIVPFTDSTTSLTTEAVNYLLYNLANTTLASDDTTGNYATELNTYLNTVDESSLQNPGDKEKLDQAEAALKAAQANFDKVEADARAIYDSDDIVPPPKPPFEQWAATNYPSYTVAKNALNLAQSTYNQAYNAYWGRINTLRGYQESLGKALDTTTHYQGYNMCVQPAGGNATFAPYYSSLDLKDQLNRWIESGSGGQDQTFVEVKIDSGTPTGSQEENGIYLKLTTKGIAKLDIHVGPWYGVCPIQNSVLTNIVRNVDNVKTLYPKRDTGAPDVLDPKYARSLSYVIAYDPKLGVEIKSGQNVKSTTKSTTTADDKPYVAVLGILAQHFPPNPTTRR